ncbi:techylectin-5A-like [Branchiostoma floridae]|uniref:Techylectin-5A-like n=1 Tax=Branchiostoma floridae TaxID=7739 RepID=A0A9J7KUU1_BRAFL|nr:techylectin-5A-like [Branchiostoma floridae]
MPMLSNEARGYALHLPSSGYTGDAGDAIRYNDGQRFSTVDRDNDDHDYDYFYGSSCSQQYGQGGWWFRRCTSYLNGRYLGNCGSSCQWRQGVMWNDWRGNSYSLKSVTMKIRP